MSLCRELPRYLDRRLSAVDAAAFEAHLVDCASCRAEAGAWAELEREIIDWTNAGAPDATEMQMAAERLVRRVRLSDPPRHAPLGGWRLAAGLGLAGVAAVVIALVALRTTSGPSLPLALSVVRGEGRPAVEAQGAILRGEAEGLLARLGPDLVGVSANGRVEVLEAQDERVRLRLHAGSVALQVLHRTRGERVEVEAHGVTVRVVGTRFMVSVTPQDQAMVAVQDGKVSVKTAEGRSLSVSSGEAALPAPDGRLFVVPMASAVAQDLESLLAPERPRLAPEPPERRDEDVSAHASAPAKGKARDKVLATSADIALWQRLILSGDFDAAERELTQHLKSAPKDVVAWSLLADSRRKAGRPSDAVKAYRQVIRFGEGAPANRARFLAASILQDELNDPAAAQPLLRAYLAANPGLRPLEAAAEVRLARCLQAAGHRSQAAAMLKAVIAEHAGTPAAEDARRQLETLSR